MFDLFRPLRRHVGNVPTLVAMTIVAAVLAIEVGVNHRETASRLLRDYDKDTSARALSAANSMSLPLWEFDLDILSEMTKSLLHSPDILSISIVETTGTQLVESGSTAGHSHVVQRRARISSPSGQTLGRLTITFSSAHVRHSVDARLRAAVARSLFVFTCLLLVLAWLARSVTRPILQLDRAVRAYNGRSVAAHVPGLDRHDELGSLARSFAEMANEIQSHVAELEMKVAERTTELKSALTEAEAASQSKSAFLASMSHEIRTPMNGVLGMAELLRQTKLTDKQSLYSQTIYDSASALLTILNDILDYSKIESGKLELDATPFDLPRVVEEVATLFGVSARQKGIELMVRIRPDTPATVLGDAGRFRQVMCNLVGNAVKFTEVGTVLIDVEARQDGDRAMFEISVIDSGIGIPANKLDTIFEKFIQSECSTTRRYGGTGLGLSISRSLLEAMGGHVTVESTLGEGSTFTVHAAFPVDVAATVDPNPELVITACRTLVIDDPAVNRTIVSEYLRIWGFEVVEAASAHDALAALDEAAACDQPIELIISDHHMPDFDGLWLVKQLSRSSTYQLIPVVVLSSGIDDDVSRRFLAHGVVDVLAKPVTGRGLRTSIAQTQLPPDSNAAAEPKAETVEPEPPATDQQMRFKVLVADDNTVNRMVVMNMLGTDRHFVSMATNGEEAVCQAIANTFDLIFMDISMPVMDGIEAMQRIRAEEEDKGRPPTYIVALTAHAMSGDRERFLELGMDGYLSKPVTRAGIQAVVDGLSAERRN